MPSLSIVLSCDRTIKKKTSVLKKSVSIVNTKEKTKTEVGFMEDTWIYQHVLNSGFLPFGTIAILAILLYFVTRDKKKQN
jgi:hypothetical protein